jgi:hypothetical protein
LEAKAGITVQKIFIAVTSACCIVLALIDLYLNYRLFELKGSLNEPASYVQTNADDTFLTLSESFYTEQRELPPALSASASADSASADTNPPAAAEPQPLYKLGVQDGYITVYYGGGPVKEVTALPTDALPFDEKLRLSEGIPVYDEAELVMLLQDYGS